MIPEHKEKCKTCKYSKRISTVASPNNIYCDYLLMAHKRRPCPADKCTVYEEKTKKAHSTFNKGKKL